MKIKVLLRVLLAIALVLSLSACGKKECQHEYDNDCDSKCNICNAVRAIEGHDLEMFAAKEPTCTEIGNDEYYICKSCDIIFADEIAVEELTAIPYIPALGHVLTTVEAVEATCTQTGHTEYQECETCGYTTTVVQLPILNHTFSNEWSWNATHHWHKANCGCEDQYTGMAEHTFDQQTGNCLCGATLYEFGDTCAHNEKVKVDMIPANCIRTGTIEHYKCKFCDEMKYLLVDGEYVLVENTEDLTIPLDLVDGHRFTINVDAKAYTCTEDGYDAHMLCDRCKVATTEHTVYPAKHEFVDIPELEATCSKDGYSAHKECSVCHTTEDKVIKPKNPSLHKFTIEVPKADPNCANNGYTAHQECEICHQTQGKEIIPMIPGAHVYTDDCDEYCNGCNLYRAVPHVVHSIYDDKCSVCGKDVPNPSGSPGNDNVVLPDHKFD